MLLCDTAMRVFMSLQSEEGNARPFTGVIRVVIIVIANLFK